MFTIFHNIVHMMYIKYRVYNGILYRDTPTMATITLVDAHYQCNWRCVKETMPTFSAECFSNRVPGSKLCRQVLPMVMILDPHKPRSPPREICMEVRH